MRLIIENAEEAHIGPAVQTNRLKVYVSGVESDDILSQIDIDQIISYFGITELLDIIGEEEIRSHLSDPADGPSVKCSVKSTGIK